MAAVEAPRSSPTHESLKDCLQTDIRCSQVLVCWSTPKTHSKYIGRWVAPLLPMMAESCGNPQCCDKCHTLLLLSRLWMPTKPCHIPDLGAHSKLNLRAPECDLQELENGHNLWKSHAQRALQQVPDKISKPSLERFA